MALVTMSIEQTSGCLVDSRVVLSIMGAMSIVLMFEIVVFWFLEYWKYTFLN